MNTSTRLDLSPPLDEVWSAASRGVPGTAAVMGYEGLLVATDDMARLVAVEAETGRRVWAYPWSATAWALHGRLVCAWPKPDELHLIDVETGRPVGCLPCPSPRSALVVEGCLVSQSSYSEWGGTRLSCLDLGSGRRRWSRALAADTSNQRASFAATAGVVVFDSTDGGLTAVDLSSGAVRWQRAWPEWGSWDREWFHRAGVGPIWFQGARVLATVGGHIVCLSLDDGRTLWEVEGTAQILYGDRLYGSGWPETYVVRSAADGSPLVKAQLAPEAPRAVGSTGMVNLGLVSETHAFVPTGRGILLAVDRDTGAYVWHHQPKGASSIVGDPVVASGRLYYRQFDRLFCLAPRGAR